MYKKLKTLTKLMKKKSICNKKQGGAKNLSQSKEGLTFKNKVVNSGNPIEYLLTNTLFLCLLHKRGQGSDKKAYNRR